MASRSKSMLEPRGCVSTPTHNLHSFQHAYLPLTHRSCVHLFTAPMHPQWLKWLKSLSVENISHLNIHAHTLNTNTHPTFNDISCDRYDNKDECLKNAEFVKTFAKRFGIGQWSFIGPGSEKKWCPSENSPQGAWDHVAEDMLLRFAESGHPIFRSTTPLSRGKLKGKGKGKVSIHFSANQDTFDTIYRIILSVNQLSVYGAVAAICDEYESHQDGTGQHVILVGQSIVLGEIKAEVPAHDEEPEKLKSFCSNIFHMLNRFHQKTD